MGENIDEFEKFLSIRQHFPNQNFWSIAMQDYHAHSKQISKVAPQHI